MLFCQLKKQTKSNYLPYNCIKSYSEWKYRKISNL